MATETFIIDVRTRGTKRSAADVKRIGTSASQVRKTLAFLRAALVAVAAVRVFGSLTSSLVQFSDQMLVVKAVTAATEVQFGRLREQAKGLGATTRFTAGEAAEGMAFLARAGLNVTEVMGAIPGVLNLAAAAQLDLGNAADIASNLMTSFGLSVADIPNVMDTLVFTANNANTTVQQLADGLKLFAPIASQLGVDLQEASAAMAVLGDAGIQASLAGTGVRRVLTDLESPTGALAKALDFMNIKFEEVRPSAVGLQGALQRLKDANVGASAASLLFGKRGGFVAAELLRALGPMGDFEQALQDIDGTSKRAAETMEEGLGGALRLVRSAIQNLIIAFADLGGEDSLNQFLRGVAEVLRAVARNADDAWAAIQVLIVAFAVSKVISFGAAIAAASARMALLTATTTAAIFTTTSYTGAVKALTLALLRLPFVAIFTTLTLLVAGFAAFRDEIKLTEDGSVTLADTFTAMENTIGRTLLDAVNSLGGEFTSFGEIVETIAERAALGFTRLVANLNGVVEVIKAVFNEFPKFFSNLGSEIQRLFFQTLQDGLNGLVSGVNSLFKALGSERRLELFDLGTLIPEATSLGADIGTAFNKGFNAVGIEVFRAADMRRSAERDAAILATEEANRRAAQARLAAAAAEARRGEGVDGGRTDLAQALRGGGADKEIQQLTDALRDLEASFFPLLAAQDAEAEVLKTIADARAKGIKLRVSEAELIKRTRREQIGANMTLEQAAEEQAVLKKALDDTIISMEEFEFLSRKASIAFLEGQRDAASGAERAFLKLTQDATDAAAFTEAAFTDAFKKIEDAVVEFAQTGTLNVNDFFRNFGEQLIRLGTQQALAGFGGFFQGQFGVGGPSQAGGGPGGLIGNLFGGGGLGSLFGFQDGGAFKVGANSAAATLPGLDNRLVAFRAQDGETVSVTPRSAPDTGGGMGVQNIVFNVEAKDADSFNRSQPQLQNRLLAATAQARRRR